MPKTKSTKPPASPPALHPVFGALLRVLILALPPLLFFSYYPVFHLGSDAAMNFEFSLPLIWLVVFFGATVPLFLRALKSFRPATILLAAVFPLYSSISILWSANPLRGLLTAGIYWLIVYAILMLIFLLGKSASPLFTAKTRPRFIQRFWQLFFGATVVVCLFCWLQCLLDLVGVDRSVSLLCAGCTYELFGFPHPSGFAIEPQFMGNLLLAPTLAALYFATQATARPRRIQLYVLAGFFAATLFLTFSRGAIYAFAVALFILFATSVVGAIKRAHKLRIGLLITPVVAFLITLCAQGCFATLGPTTDTFSSGVTKSIHQLSLGLIDLRPATDDTEVLPASPELSEVTTNTTTAGGATRGTPAELREATAVGDVSRQDPRDSIFSGYVAESTDVRLSLTGAALSLWSSTPANLLFGTGLGSAGTALYAAGLTTSLKEIVQNEYTSTLLELGLIGIIILAAVIISIFALIIRAQPISRPDSRPLLAALLVAYLITLCFFSGPANALQIYLLPPLLFLAYQTPLFHNKYNSKSPLAQ